MDDDSDVLHCEQKHCHDLSDFNQINIFIIYKYNFFFSSFKGCSRGYISLTTKGKTAQEEVSGTGIYLIRYCNESLLPLDGTVSA